MYRGKENRNWKYANRNRLIDASSSLSGWRGRANDESSRSCVSTPFLVVPSRKTRRQGNRLIMRRCLYESVARACTFVKWRFTATFTLPLLYASRILSDASEFAFISNELGNLYRVEKRLTRWIIDEIFISTRERGKKEKKKKKDFHLKEAKLWSRYLSYFSSAWLEVFLQGEERITRQFQRIRNVRKIHEAINCRDNKEWGAWSNRWRDPSKGK